MAIPAWNHFMRPVLMALAAAGGPLPRSQLREEACRLAKITDQELQDLLKSGQSVADNRAGWAISYLKAAGLGDNKVRGTWEITPSGRAYLQKAPHVIAEHDLEAFPQYQEFLKRSRDGVKQAKTSKVQDVQSLTADERLEQAHKELSSHLADSCWRLGASRAASP